MDGSTRPSATGSKGPDASLRKVMPPTVSGPKGIHSAKSPPIGMAPSMVRTSSRPIRTVVGPKSAVLPFTQPSGTTRPKVALNRPTGSHKLPPVAGSEKPVSVFTPAGSTKRPAHVTTSPLTVNATSATAPASSVGSSYPHGTSKQYFSDPGSPNPKKRATAWYPSEPDEIKLHVSPQAGSTASPVRHTYRVADEKDKDAPPEFLAQQWQGQQGSGTFGWWQGRALQDDVIVGTLCVMSMDLSMLPPTKYKTFEEKAALDVSRLFSHPPWHVSVSVEPGSVILRYRLELPDPGPNSGAVLSRAAAEFGKRAVRLPDLEREYRILTGTDVPAIIDYGKSEAPTASKRAKPMTPQASQEMQFQSHNAPLHVAAVEGQRRVETVGPHKSFDGSKEWAELPARPPPLPGLVAAAVPLQTEINLPRVPGDSFSPRPINAVAPAAASVHGPPSGGGRHSGDHHPSPSPSQVDLSAFCMERRSLSPPTNRNSVSRIVESDKRRSVPGGRELSDIRRKLDPFLREMEAKYADAGRQGNAVLQAQILGELGARFHEAGDYERSVVYLSRQVELLQKLDHPDRVADMSKAYSMMGNAYWSMGAWEKALTYHQRRLEIAEMQKDRRGMGAAYGNLGNVYHAMGDYRAATQYHMRHHNCVDGDDMDTMGAVYHNLGLAQYGSGDIEAALDSFRHALEITVSVGNQQQAARLHGNLAMAYKAKGKLQEAVNELHLQLKAELRIQELANAASTSLSLGNIYVSQGDYQNALQYYERGIDLCDWQAHSVASKPRLAAKLLIASGSCKYHIGEHTAALTDLDKALHIASDPAEADLRAATHSNMGLCLNMLKEYEKGLQHHNRHLELARQLGDRTAEGTAHGNIGTTYKLMGQHNKALQHHEIDLDIARTTGDRLAQGQAYDNLGLCCHELGEYALAVDYHTKALNIMRQVGYRAGEAEAHAHLGVAHDKVGHAKQAIQHHYAHLELAKEHNDIEGQGRAYGALGKACFDYGMHQKAVEYQTMRLRIARQLGDPIAEARAHGHLFLAYSALNDGVNAESHLQRHRDLCRQHSLHTIEETEDGVCHIKMEIAEALQDADGNSRAARRLAEIATSLG